MYVPRTEGEDCIDFRQTLGMRFCIGGAGASDRDYPSDSQGTRPQLPFLPQTEPMMWTTPTDCVPSPIQYRLPWAPNPSPLPACLPLGREEPDSGIVGLGGEVAVRWRAWWSPSLPVTV